MSDRPAWMEYADLASKWAVPVAIFGATAYISAINSERLSKDTRLQACIDKQFRLADFDCKEAQCENLSEKEGKRLNNLTKAVAAVCEGTGFEITEGVRAAVSSAGASTNNVAIAADVYKSAGREVRTIKAKDLDTAEKPPPIVVRPAESNSLSPNPPPRLYVQISEASQRGRAALLISKLDEAEFQGERLNALGPDLKPINRTQLRCVTKADCALAADLAAYISSVMNTAVPVVDLSSLYEGKSGTRSRHYELWIAPGNFAVAGTPLADGIEGPASKRAIEQAAKSLHR